MKSTGATVVRKSDSLLGAGGGGGGGGGAKIDPVARKSRSSTSEKTSISSRSGSSASRNLIRRGVISPSSINKKSDSGVLSRFGLSSKSGSASSGKPGKIVRSSSGAASVKSTAGTTVKELGDGRGAGVGGGVAEVARGRRGGAGAGGGRVVRSADAATVRTPRSVANVPDLESAVNSSAHGGLRRESGWSGSRGHNRHYYNDRHYYDRHHHRRHHSHWSHVSFGFGYPWGYHSYYTGYGYSSWRSSFWFGSPGIWVGAYDPWYYEPYYYGSYYTPYVSYRRSHLGLGSGYYCPHHYLNLHYCGCNHVQVVDPGPVVIEEVEVPPVVVEPAGDGGGAAAPPPVEAIEPEPEAGGAAVEGLRPAQLRCWSALESFRGGDYNDSAEAFYNALLEDPDNKVIKVLLAESLFAIGEYRYAARYLREALVDWEEFPGYQWSPAGLYSKAEDFSSRLKSLEDEASAHPENEDLQVVLGYERFVHGQPDGAKSVFGTLATSSSDEATRKLSARFLKRIESVAAGEGKELAPPAETPTSRFLKSLSLEDLKSLEMR